MAIDSSVLKEFIKARRDYYINTRGKYNNHAAAMQEVLIEMNEEDNTVVTADDLKCDGLES